MVSLPVLSEVEGSNHARGLGACPEPAKSWSKCPPRECHALSAAKLSGRAPSHYCLLRTKQGESIWVHVTHLVIPSVNRDLDSVEHMSRDFTMFAEAKRLFEKLLPYIAQIPE